MKFSGLCNLKRNGSPGCNTRNVRDPLGCQKLTSSGASRVRCSYQFLSVTPTQIFIGHFFQVTTSVRGRHSNVGAKKGRLASLQALEILVAGEDLNLRPTL